MRNTAFQDLYAGRRPLVYMAIHAEATKANPAGSHKRKVRSGIYAISSQDFRCIIHEIAGRWGNAENLCRSLDRDGAGKAWFRWSKPVARWLQTHGPVMQADAVVSGPLQ